MEIALVGLVGLMFGAAACGLYFRVALVKQRAEAEGWRTKYEGERLENSKYEGLVQQLAPLVSIPRQSDR
jgi:hypothetical protein